MVKITKNLRSTQFKHGLFFCEGNYNNMYLITQSDKLSKWKTQAKIKNNWNLRVLTLEINRDMLISKVNGLSESSKKDPLWDLGDWKKVPWPAAYPMGKMSSWQSNNNVNYWIQGIELFQKLCIGLEYMVPNAMGKSS